MDPHITAEQFELSCAASRVESDEVRRLLAMGVNPNFSCSYGQTPLHLAIDSEIDWNDPDPEPPEATLARLLLEHGANPNAKTESGETPLDWAHGNLFDLRRLYSAIPIHGPAYRVLKEYGGKHGFEIP